MESVLTWLGSLGEDPATYALVLAAGSLVVALSIDWVFKVVVERVVSRTQTDVDDVIVKAIRRPLAVTVLLVGLWGSLTSLDVPAPGPYIYRGVLMSLAVVHWSAVAFRIAGLVLDAISRPGAREAPVNVRTRPIFALAAKLAIVGGTTYFLLLAWQIDLTAWLASAGIVGLAVGFAAQESLSNLFAGVTILADSPYKIGDFLVVDNGERGRVTQIGFRSTRILTQDDVEIIIPNARMASSTIVNESGGPYEKSRIRLPIGVAYGSDLDKVRAILLDVARTASTHVVLEHPENQPAVRFLSFGESALQLELQVWIYAPETRMSVIDVLNTQMYERLRAAQIEIPYPKRDVYLHQAE